MRMQVVAEKGHGVAGEGILIQDDCVPFKELVSLVARQEKLEGSVIDDDGVAFAKFLGIPQLSVIWPSEFT